MGVLIEGFHSSPGMLCTTYTYLYDRVVYIDGRHGQTIILCQLVETMDTSDTLLHHTSHVLGSTRELVEESVSHVATVVQYHSGLPTRALEGGQRS